MRQLTSREVRRPKRESLRYTLRMTTLLQQAFSEISQLSDEEQDVYAARILEDLAAETAFDEKLAATAHLLGPMVRRARENQRAGLSLPFDPDAIELPYRP